MIRPLADGQYRVTCTDVKCLRPLTKVVGSSIHAENLLAKHYREVHPTQEVPVTTTVAYDGPPLLLDVSAAARAYLRHPHRFAAGVWSALIGVDSNDVAKLTEVAEGAVAAGSLLGYTPTL